MIKKTFFKKKTLRMLPPTFKPVSQQIRLIQVAPGAYWILTGKNYGEVALYLGVTSLAAKQVCLGPAKLLGSLPTPSFDKIHSLI